MEDRPVERRREQRFSIENRALVHRKNGETLQAMAIDISGTGVRLKFEQPNSVDLDEQVTLEIELPTSPDQPFAAWGAGRVAHVEGNIAGIQLSAGHFDSL